jgi:hypothetical protein
MKMSSDNEIKGGIECVDFEEAFWLWSDKDDDEPFPFVNKVWLEKCDVWLEKWEAGPPSGEKMDETVRYVIEKISKEIDVAEVAEELATYFGLSEGDQLYEQLYGKVFLRLAKEATMLGQKREHEASASNSVAGPSESNVKKSKTKNSKSEPEGKVVAKVPLEEFLEDLLLYALPNKHRGVLDNLSKETAFQFTTEDVAILQDSDGTFYVEIWSLLKNNLNNKKTLLKRIGAAMELKNSQSMKVQVEYVLPMLEAFFKFGSRINVKEFQRKWEAEREEFEECKIPRHNIDNFRAMIEKVYVEVSEGSWLDQIDTIIMDVGVQKLCDVAERVGLPFATPKEFLERLKKCRRGLVFRAYQLLKPVQPAVYVAAQIGYGKWSEGIKNGDSGANWSNETGAGSGSLGQSKNIDLWQMLLVQYHDAKQPAFAPPLRPNWSAFDLSRLATKFVKQAKECHVPSQQELAEAVRSFFKKEAKPKDGVSKPKNGFTEQEPIFMDWENSNERIKKRSFPEKEFIRLLFRSLRDSRDSRMLYMEIEFLKAWLDWERMPEMFKTDAIRVSSQESVGKLSLFRVDDCPFVGFEDTSVGLWNCKYKIIGMIDQFVEKPDEIVLTGSFEKKPIGLISGVFGTEDRFTQLRVKTKGLSYPMMPVKYKTAEVSLPQWRPHYDDDLSNRIFAL